MEGQIRHVGYEHSQIQVRGSPGNRPYGYCSDFTKCSSYDSHGIWSTYNLSLEHHKHSMPSLDGDKEMFVPCNVIFYGNTMQDIWVDIGEPTQFLVSSQAAFADWLFTNICPHCDAIVQEEYDDKHALTVQIKGKPVNRPWGYLGSLLRVDDGLMSAVIAAPHIETSYKDITQKYVPVQLYYEDDFVVVRLNGHNYWINHSSWGSEMRRFLPLWDILEDRTYAGLDNPARG